MGDDRTPTQNASLNSRLLPKLFDWVELEGGGTLRIMDLGPARGGTLDFLAAYDCRLQIADVAPELQRWCEQWLADPDRPEAAMEAELDEILGPEMSPPADICLLWDTLNYLDAALLPLFARGLSRRLAPGALLYGFAALNNTTDLAQQLYSIVGPDHLSVKPAGRGGSLPYRHTQAALKARLREFNIEQTILRNDGRLEMLLKHRATA